MVYLNQHFLKVLLYLVGKQHNNQIKVDRGPHFLFHPGISSLQHQTLIMLILCLPDPPESVLLFYTISTAPSKVLYKLLKTAKLTGIYSPHLCKNPRV